MTNPNTSNSTPNVTIRRKGPKPGSVRRSKAEIVTSRANKLFSLIEGRIDPNMLASIKAQLASAAASSTRAVASTGVHPRLSETRQNRLPIARALSRLDTRRKRIAELREEIAALEPMENDGRQLVDYYNNVEAILVAAIGRGENLDSVAIPAAPNGSTTFFRELKQSNSNNGNAIPNTTPTEEIEDGEDDTGEIDDDFDSEDDDDGE